MHPSALESTRRLVDSYVPKNTSLNVLDVGSRQVVNQKLSHRELFDLECCRYTGVDLEAGRNVDVVLDKPYGLPFDDNSMDVIICGQVFEHIPFFWVTALEFARVVRTDGFIILSAPSRGHVHDNPDCWRFYEQGYAALAEFCDLRCVEVSTDFPPLNPKSGRFDYSEISSEGYSSTYWGDTVGILQKTHLYRADKMASLRTPLIDWANQCAGGGPGGRKRVVPSTLRRVRRRLGRTGRAAARRVGLS